MAMTLDNADAYRELRAYVKPDDMHGAVDEMLNVLGAWSVKIEPLYEAGAPEDWPLDGPMPEMPLAEYIITGRFDGDPERGSAES